MKKLLKKPKPKLYGILGSRDEKYYGYVECSFSMDWSSQRIRVWSKEDAEHHVKEIREADGKRDKKLFSDIFICRLHSAAAPIIITQWEPEKANRNYDRRNAWFKIK